LEERGKIGAVTSPAAATISPPDPRTTTDPRCRPSTKPDRTTSASCSPPSYVLAIRLILPDAAAWQGGRMEFRDVVRTRRMVRNYAPDRSVPGEVLDEVLRHATHAPSAGFSQGWAFLVLDQPEDVTRFWETTTPGGPSGWLAGMRKAPVIIVPLSDKSH